MKTIIAPTDFSTGSLNAVSYAAELAVIFNARLLIINIIALPISITEITFTEATIAELEESDEKEFSKLKNKLMVQTDGKIDIKVIAEVGTVEHELKEICNREKPFAVVMSAKNSTAMERFFEGSNALSLIHNIPYPILIIPETYSFKRIQKIAFACDLEKNIQGHTLSVIKELISFFNASLHVVNIVAKELSGPENIVNSISVQNKLHEFRPVFHFINEKKVEHGIDEFIKQNRPDLLIVIPQSHGLFHKSHSKPFLLHTGIPVLAVSEIV
jgi:nucleotide-binding universal stress UspA family protein